MNVLMPQLGETVSSGKITSWFKKVGDAVAPGDNLFEIETDKTSMEVPATVAGTLAEIRVGDGIEAPVGAIVGIIAAVDGPPAPMHAPIHQPPASARLDPFHEVRTPLGNFGAARLAGGIAITPLARRLAREAGIDPATIAGSGPKGRVVKIDIAAAIAKKGGALRAAPSTAPGLPSAPIAIGATAEQVKSLYRDRAFEEQSLDPMRRSIARRLVEAKQTIPHFYLVADYDVDALLQMREQANAAAPMNENGAPAYKLSVNDFIVKAFALALQRVPAANAVWAEDRILRFKAVDLGVAVAIEGGLITPVVRDADSKPLAAISTEIRTLAARARERKLQPAEYQGGASTVSNLGGHGVREFSAIINPPQATILAVGAAHRRPIEEPDGGVRFVSQITVTLSCDHRVVDGAVGAELLQALKALIAQPIRLLL